MPLREQAREIFLDSLHRVAIRPVLRRKLLAVGSHLRIGAAAYDLDNHRHVLIIAVGKAALPMTEGLLEALAPTLKPTHRLEGVVVCPAAPAAPDPRLIYRIGSHPVPDESSAEAATMILNLLHKATEDTLVFFLLSGGASAMIELPLSPALTPTELAAVHRALVHSGLSIAEMNTLRKHLSRVKGGRLATAAPLSTQCTLLISDVQPSQPDVIGSGPSLPDPTTLADCRDLLRTRLAGTVLPAPVYALLNALLNDPSTPDTPKPDHPAFRRATHHTLLSSDDLADAAQASAQARGFRTVVDQTADEWPFAEAAAYLRTRLQSLADTYPGQPLCLISTGEISVPVTIPHSGSGGRNQHFALHCATQMAGSSRPMAVLSAGSDGADGNSPAAGAAVDETTCSRAAQLGFDSADALASFNAFPLLHAIGDSILTGATGNNLRDLRLLLLDPMRTGRL